MHVQANCLSIFQLLMPAVSLYSGVMESEAMGLFTVESVTTFARRCGQATVVDTNIHLNGF